MRLASRLAAATLAALTLAAPAAAYDTADMQRKLAAEMSRAGLGSGAVVRDMDSGTDLYAFRPDVVRIPASVEKLYTTAATLLRLGPATTLDTVAAATGPVTPDGVLQGDLHLVGAGDPFFGARSATLLAQQLRAAGITAVAGGVVGNESLFDTRRSGKGRGFDFELGGVLSALAYDRGIAGGRAQTRAAAFAAGRFAALLNAADVKQGRRSRTGVTPPTAVTLAQVPSLPVRELIRFVNVPSNNFAAEMLLKGLGAREAQAGTTVAGAAVVRDTLDDFGVRPRYLDGSGLSRSNRTTPRQVVRLLERMYAQEVSATFRASLAVAGRTGTIRRRMRGTPAAGRCQAKTGTLRGVSALAGYCRSRSGRTFGFAFMTNRLSIFKAQGIQDRMAAALARVDEADPVVAPTPDPTSPGGTLPG